MTNRGEITEGKFEDSKLLGFYYFKASSIANITDKPKDLNSGGTLFNFTSGNNIMTQIIVDNSGYRWYRLGSGDFVKIGVPFSDIINLLTKYYKDNGSINTSTFEESNKIGSYNFPTSLLTNITDKPNGLTRGGVLFNFNTGANAKGQLILDVLGRMWFRFGNEPFTRITNERDVVWYAMGDSITQGFYSENGEIAGPTNDNIVTNIAKLNGYNFTNYAEGGSGYVHKATVLSKLNAREKADTINFANCDLVTLAFGVNDWHYNCKIGTVEDDFNVINDTMCANMKYCINKIMSDNPLCKIIVLTPFNCSKYGGDFNSNWGLGTSLETSGTLQNVIDKIIEVCDYYGLEYIDQSKISIVNRINTPIIMNDGIHPTLESFKVIAKDLASKINIK